MTFLSKIFDKLGRRRVITERNSTEPYLIRFYVFLKDRKNFPFNITLHKVLKSDEPTLHDHPWNYSTLILKGGYYENTPEGRFWRGPGHFRMCQSNNTHRIELDPNVQAWTLFMPGPQRKDWGFIKDGKWIQHEKYLASRKMLKE